VKSPANRRALASDRLCAGRSCLGASPPFERGQSRHHNPPERLPPLGQSTLSADASFAFPCRAVARRCAECLVASALTLGGVDRPASASTLMWTTCDGFRETRFPAVGPSKGPGEGAIPGGTCWARSRPEQRRRLWPTARSTSISELSPSPTSAEAHHVPGRMLVNDYIEKVFRVMACPKDILSYLNLYRRRGAYAAS